jgi:hypothetical protein
MTALAEAFNSLFKAELVLNRGPWQSINDVEVAVAEWYNDRRLHSEIGLVSSVEHKTHHSTPTPATLEFALPPNPVLDTVAIGLTVVITPRAAAEPAVGLRVSGHKDDRLDAFVLADTPCIDRSSP